MVAFYDNSNSFKIGDYSEFLESDRFYENFTRVDDRGEEIFVKKPKIWKNDTMVSE
jgi:hypothetical protein